MLRYLIHLNLSFEKGNRHGYIHILLLRVEIFDPLELKFEKGNRNGYIHILLLGDLQLDQQQYLTFFFFFPLYNVGFLVKNKVVRYVRI